MLLSSQQTIDPNFLTLSSSEKNHVRTNSFHSTGPQDSTPQSKTLESNKTQRVDMSQKSVDNENFLVYIRKIEKMKRVSELVLPAINCTNKNQKILMYLLAQMNIPTLIFNSYFPQDESIFWYFVKNNTFKRILFLDKSNKKLIKLRDSEVLLRRHNVKIEFQ